MNKTLNFRYLIRLLVIFAVVAVVVILVHRRQAGRQAQAFLHQADLAEQSGDFSRAGGYLRRFLALRPHDTDGRARLALLMAQTARTGEEKLHAFLELEEVLREDPKRDDVRRKDIAMAMDPQLRRFAEAMDHIVKCLADNPDDGTLHDLKGQCLIATGDYSLAVDSFAAAVKRKPDLIPAYGRWAALLRQRLDKPIEADVVVETLLNANTDSAPAHLVAAGYYKQFGT